MATPLAQRFVGTSVPRSEDDRILSGQATYIDDLMLPDMLHAVFFRSSLAHANITKIDISHAQASQGVHEVLTGSDLQKLLNPDAGSPGIWMVENISFSVLATTRVRFVGDLLAVVIADTRYLAEDAAELIEVTYEPLQVIADAKTALDPSSEPIFTDLGCNLAAPPTSNTHGDIEDVFSKADRIFHTTIEQHRHQNVPMECRGCVSDFDTSTGRLTHYGSNQGVGLARVTLSEQLGLDLDDVRVLCKDIGGSFGLKIGASREEVAVAAVSRLINRPIKWAEDRTEHMMASGHAREETLEVDTAVTKDGLVLGMKVRMICDTGSYPALGRHLGGIVERMFPGPYKMEALQFEYVPVVTNKAPYIAYRGPWAAETFTRERVFNLIAQELEIDPAEFRLRNMKSHRESPGRMITGRTLTSCTARESLETLLDLIDIEEFRSQQAVARENGRHLGIGIATYIEGAPGPRDDTDLGDEVIKMQLEVDGSVTVFTGQMPHGQGHETTFAQIAADEMGVHFDQVLVVVGDSDLVPHGNTGGSRAAAMAGGGTLHAARDLAELTKKAAANLLEASIEDIELSAGSAHVKGVPSSAIPLAEIAKSVEVNDTTELDSAPFQVEQRYKGGQGGWAGGSHCAVVEVDIETGQVRIERYIVVEDCGTIINPAIVEGQIRGGIAQGIGAVLLEHSAYDEHGNFLASTFMDYLLPSTTEVPRIEIHHLESIPNDPYVNFRGVGEGGMIVAPPTLVNAIEDALQPYGAKITEQHLPPEKVASLARR